MGSNPVAVTYTSDIAPASRKEFLDIQASIACRFTLKLLGDIIKTCSQIHRTDRYLQYSSIIQASLAKWLSVRLRIKWL